jgi:hypothetical protein
MPDFSNSKNKFKINNPYGEGSHNTSSNHGTNKNYQMSGPPFWGGIKKAAGNFIKGKGALGALNPIGAIANRMGAFGKNDPQTPPTAAAPAPAAAGAVDPSAPPVDPNMMDPNATNA